MSFLRKIVSVFKAERNRFTSAGFWENRYASGGNSGAGSYNHLAQFKAEVLNGIVNEFGIRSVIELGCGDGNNLEYYQIQQYTGGDVSPAAIAVCRSRWAKDASKTFVLMSDLGAARAELAISFDVIFHLVEDSVYETYLGKLFSSATRFVLIYSSHVNFRPPEPHVRHRNFLQWCYEHQPEWLLTRFIPNRFPTPDIAVFDPKSSFSDFFLFRRA